MCSEVTPWGLVHEEDLMNPVEEELHPAVVLMAPQDSPNTAITTQVIRRGRN